MIHRRKNLFLEWLRSKALLQAVSLVIAVAAWMIVNSGQRVVQTRILKLQYIQVPSGLLFQRTPPAEIKVDLLGSNYRLRSIRDEDLKYWIDMSASHGGVNRVELELEGIKVPGDVEVVHIKDRSFSVVLEERDTRNLPVKVVTVGKPAEGRQLISMTPRPAEVSVTGPKSVLAHLDEIKVEVSVLHREASFRETIHPQVNLPEVEVVDSVQVDVEIAVSRIRQDLTDLPVVGSLPHAKIRVSPEKARVVVECPEGALIGLKDKIQVVVPLEGLKKGRYRLRGQVVLPAGVKLISLEPEKFLVEVLHEGVRELKP